MPRVTGNTLDAMFAREITVTTGTGEGPTPLAAFDAALLDCGVANYNLIPLSSVIPPQSRVVQKKYVTPLHEYGHKLYVVMAVRQVDYPMEVAVAGVGWVQNPAQRNHGLFVEIGGNSVEWVADAIHSTLTTMIDNRQEAGYGEIQSAISMIKCVDSPVCALSIAVYQSQGW